MKVPEEFNKRENIRLLERERSKNAEKPRNEMKRKMIRRLLIGIRNKEDG